MRTSCCHQVQIAFPCKHGEQVEDIEKEILIGLGHFAYEGFVCCYGIFLVKRPFSFRCSELAKKTLFLQQLRTKGIAKLKSNHTWSVTHQWHKFGRTRWYISWGITGSYKTDCATKDLKEAGLRTGIWVRYRRKTLATS